MWDWDKLCNFGGGHPLSCLYSHQDGSWVVMQYTGLKDRNDTEIYEGDVIKETGGLDVDGLAIHRRFVVRFGLYDNDESYDDRVSGNGWWLDGYTLVRDGKIERHIQSSPVHDMEGLYGQEAQEVIGNIYEHPHLLDDQETTTQ